MPPRNRRTKDSQKLPDKIVKSNSTSDEQDEHIISSETATTKYKNGKPPSSSSMSSSDISKHRKPSSTDTRSICWKVISFVKYLLIAIVIPPFLNYASLQREMHGIELPGVQYDIGLGQKMYMSCKGKGTPTVILDAPTGMSSDVWILVQEQIAKVTKVCIYDRAGLGFSDRPNMNYSQTDGDSEKEVNNWKNRWSHYTVERMVDDFHQLVSVSSQQPKPFILVGSEIGALVARFYTQLFESDVSDLVLIDPLVEDIFTQDSGVWAHFWFGQLVPSFQALQLAAAVGLTRLALLVGLVEQPIRGDSIPDDVISRQKHLLCHPRHMSTVVDEHHFINETFSQMRTLWTLKQFPSNVSVTVLTGNYYDDQLPSSLNKAWAKSQQSLMSKIHPSSKHLVVNGADHRMMYRTPSAVSEPIVRIVKQTRHKLKTKTKAK